MHARTDPLNRTALAEGLSPVSLLLPPAVVTAVMWITRASEATAVSVLCAHLVLQMAWGSYLLWRKQNRGGLPVFSMVASMYWVYFAIQLFWGDRTLSITTRTLSVSEDSVTQALEMVLLGVVSMFVGMQIPIRGPALAAQRLPDIEEHGKTSLGYIGVLIALGATSTLYSGVFYVLGGDLRQVMVILTSTVPTVGFALLFRKILIDPKSGQRPLVIAVGTLQVLVALASGWLGPLVNLGITSVGLITIVRRRVPTTPILVTAVAIMFLQVGKDAFRAEFWGAGMGIQDADTSTVLDRAGFWLQKSTDQWAEAFKAGGDAKSSELASRTTQRTSLLTQVAHVVEMCPSQVPYQNGQTYYYLLVTLIPRFLWPDKPSVSEANQFYQVAFGLTDVRSLQSTSIAVGSLAEGYINFGWFGVVLIMLVIGIVLGIYERTFVGNQSNVLLLAIGAALLPVFLNIEWQLAQYLGGVVQQVVLSFLVFLPITKKRRAFGFVGRVQPLAVRS